MMRQWKRDKETGLLVPLGLHGAALRGAARAKHDYECELYWATVSCGGGATEWGYCDEFYLCSSCNSVGGNIRAVGGGTAPTTPNGYEITGLKMYEGAGGDDYSIYLYVHDSTGNLHSLAVGDITAMIMTQNGVEYDAGFPTIIHRANNFDGYYRWTSFFPEWPTGGTNAWHRVSIDGENF